MSSTEVSPTESAAKLPLMPTWPGTQIKTVSFPSLVKSICSSRICTKTGCSNFRLNIAFSNESESDSIKKDSSWEQHICFRVKGIARNNYYSALYMELLSGRWQIKGLLEHFVETASWLCFRTICEKKFQQRIFWNKLQIKMFVCFWVSCIFFKIWLNQSKP